MGERCRIAFGIGLRLVISTPERTRMMVESAYDETRATARLPNLDIEFLHRRPWEGNEEQLVVMLRAVPSFEAVGRWLEVSNPLLVWTRMMGTGWAPWVARPPTAPSPSFRPPSLPGFDPGSQGRADH